MIHFDLKALVRFKQAVTLDTEKKVSAAWGGVSTPSPSCLIRQPVTFRETPGPSRWPRLL
jgi:hypothetical protein